MNCYGKPETVSTINKGMEMIFEEPEKYTRAKILEEAAKIVTTDREEQYGGPENNFAIIAEFWSTYASAVAGREIVFTAHAVAIMMCLLKIARIATGQPKADNYIDLAGYTACAGEIELEGKE